MVVQPDAIIDSVNFVQLLFSVDARIFLVPGFGGYLAQDLALDPLHHNVVALFDREKQGFEHFIDAVIRSVLQDGAPNVTTGLSTSAWVPL